MDENQYYISRGFSLNYLVGRVQELIDEGCDVDSAITGIAEGHELPHVQEAQLRLWFQA